MSYYINLNSMTLALRAQKILEKNDIESTVGKAVGNEVKKYGCSWGVYVKNAPREKVLGLLRCEGISGGTL